MFALRKMVFTVAKINLVSAENFYPLPSPLPTPGEVAGCSNTKYFRQPVRGKRLSGIKFRRQQTIGGYIVDFVSMEYKIIIELDGGQHAEQAAYDHARTEFLNRQGYRVVRFWNNEVLQNTEAVLEQILKYCGSDCPHPNPPPLETGEGTS